MILHMIMYASQQPPLMLGFGAIRLPYGQIARLEYLNDILIHTYEHYSADKREWGAIE